MVGFYITFWLESWTRGKHAAILAEDWKDGMGFLLHYIDIFNYIKGNIRVLYSILYSRILYNLLVGRVERQAGLGRKHASILAEDWKDGMGFLLHYIDIFNYIKEKIANKNKKEYEKYLRQNKSTEMDGTNKR